MICSPMWYVGVTVDEIPVFLISDMHVPNKNIIGNFVSISSLTVKCAAHHAIQLSNKQIEPTAGII